MKNVLFMVIATLATCLGTRAADESALVIVDNNGAETSVSTQGLLVQVENGSLVVENTEGTRSYELASLQKMFFGSSTGTVDMTLTGVDTRVSLYYPSGVKAGEYDSLNAARSSSVAPGLYIVKRADGSTFKTVLK